MVLGRQHAITDHTPDRGGTDGKGRGCFVDRHLTTLAAFALAVRRNLLANGRVEPARFGGGQVHSQPAKITFNPSKNQPVGSLVDCVEAKSGRSVI